MMTKRGSDGVFPARRAPSFPPASPGQKEAPWRGVGWQDCLRSDPLRLFLGSFLNNVKVGLSSTAPLLPTSASKVQSRDQRQP